MQENKHIVVGENGRCLCGTYIVAGKERSISCADILAIKDSLPYRLSDKAIDGCNVLRAVIDDYVVVCG